MKKNSQNSYTVQLISTDTPEQWRSFLPAARSVFGSVEFAAVQEKQTGYPVRLFVYSAGSVRVAYPLIMRSTADLPFQEGGLQRWDTRTPEYTGPVLLAPLNLAQAQDFIKRFNTFCRETGIIAEFAHLHPWNEWQPLLDPAGVEFDREIVYIDLTVPVDDLWRSSFSHACRKNIQRARRENIQVYPAQTLDHIREFYRIYIATMDRNHARPGYYFSLEYFTAFFENMPQHALFMLAEHEGRVIAGTLYLHDDENIYSYLGGADHEFQHMRPTNAVIFETIVWGQRLGKRRLVLGGGYQPDDGIFRFKASFSTLRANFCTYRRIHLPEEYQALCSAWSNYYRCGLEEAHFFPLYRSSADVQEEKV